MLEGGIRESGAEGVPEQNYGFGRADLGGGVVAFANGLGEGDEDGGLDCWLNFVAGYSGGRADAESIVEEDGVSSLRGVFYEIVFFRVFGGVPVTTSLIIRYSARMRSGQRKYLPPVIPQAMCCDQHRFRCRTSMFRRAKGGSNSVRAAFLSRIAKRRRSVPRRSDGEKVNELVVVGPRGAGPLQVVRRDRDGNGVVVTMSARGGVRIRVRGRVTPGVCCGCGKIV